MGNWNITVRGVGSHHNKSYEKDANKMAAKFVADLKAAGHHVVSASITHGGEDDISNPEAYLAGLPCPEPGCEFPVHGNEHPHGKRA